MKTRIDLIKSIEKNLNIAELGVFKGEFSSEIYKYCKPKNLYLVDLFDGSVTSGDVNGENIEKIHALKNISIELKDKEVVGLVGKNGSGKSTLLKVISGILKPTSGDLLVEGEVFYLCGFYHGMNKNLSMRDNIYIIGTLNGLSRNEITTKVKEIAEFSEISKFLDTPIHKFSNGMVTRLAFTTTIFTILKSPDVLLIDEALGGGLDDSFKEKSIKKIKDYIDSAKVVVIASHNSNYILENCSKVIWIDNGEVKKIGSAEDVILEYRENLHNKH
jgi:ABC-type polysaccharide/polyol phosphate transport system ATPase subunit